MKIKNFKEGLPATPRSFSRLGPWIQFYKFQKLLTGPYDQVVGKLHRHLSMFTMREPFTPRSFSRLGP